MTSHKELNYLKKKMKKISQDGIVVEVGSWLGDSAIHLAKGIKRYGKDAKLYCIDIWSKEYYATHMGFPDTKIDPLKVFEKNMGKWHHITMQEESTTASAKFKDGTIDLIFIDANHDYEYVKADCIAWLPKIKKGGIMCGHDYSAKFPGVQKAVNELFSSFTLPIQTIWEIIV